MCFCFNAILLTAISSCTCVYSHLGADSHLGLSAVVDHVTLLNTFVILICAIHKLKS